MRRAILVAVVLGILAGFALTSGGTSVLDTSAAQAHVSHYCGRGIQVTGDYAVVFVGQHWRDNADEGSRSLVRTYKHFKRIGGTSQFKPEGIVRNKVCGGILL